MSTIGRIYTKDFSEIKEEIRGLRKLKWYQKWWGAFILGFLSGLLSGVIVAIFFR